MATQVKAIVLFSGGLDSILAVKILQAQNIEVEGVCFESDFYNAKSAKKSAEAIGLELHVLNLREAMIELVKNPPSGYGKNLNPCIDCHALMIRTVSEKLNSEKKFDIIATGEVLGQRPFSQNKDALSRVQKLAGVEVLRPLSAKLLPETEYESSGLVTRGRLLDISGRSRDRQFELADKYGIEIYSTPAGGCLLTDPEFSQRLNLLMSNWPDFGTLDVEMIKNGRVFWFNYLSKEGKSYKVLLLVGRNKEESEKLEEDKKAGDIIVKLDGVMGPTSKLRLNNKILNPEFRIPNRLELNIPESLNIIELRLHEEKSDKELIDVACMLTGYYATKARGQKIKFQIASFK